MRLIRFPPSLRQLRSDQYRVKKLENLSVSPDNYEYIDPQDPRLAKLADKWKRPDLADEYDGDRSRAAMAFSVACIGAGVSEEIIGHCLMTWEIGEHIPATKAMSKRALTRTIERARNRVAEAPDELPACRDRRATESRTGAGRSDRISGRTDLSLPTSLRGVVAAGYGSVGSATKQPSWVSATAPLEIGRTGSLGGCCFRPMVLSRAGEAE